ncbi:hypothetical protein GQ54DRAFT_40312 [Martensiomyces pterosporus]|nr:hypothetical protein GQ54DRAFT_40312 [Martensiomyces pterosporus]
MKLAPGRMRPRCAASGLSKTGRRFTHSSTKDSKGLDIDDIRDSARSLQTDSGPTQKPLAAAVEALRQRAQSSPWVQQASSGARQCTFTHLYVPHDMLLRIKPKEDPRKVHKTIQAVDELERFSPSTGKSSYYPSTARGVFATVSDPAIKRTMDEIGWIRSDIVEHASRVLRLRALSEMHRAHVQLFAHWKSNPQMLAIPERGTTFGCRPSRISVIRMEVYGRVQRQDAMWQGQSPYIALPCHSKDAECQMPVVLPPGGLQCVIEVPPPIPHTKLPIDEQPLSVSSELYARKIWKAAAKLHGELGGVKEETAAVPSARVDFDVLAQFQPWGASVVTGQPESRDEPTVSLQALERLYSMLPRLTPASCVISERDRKRSRKAKKKGHAGATGGAGQADQQQDAKLEQPPVEAQGLRSYLDISYEYSLTQPGCSFASAVDGRATKRVPVYCAHEIFGQAVASTVVLWLLSTAISLRKDASEQSHTTSSPQYIGVVALPCTAELATQLHRIVSFQKV